MKELFVVPKGRHSRGSVLFRWSPSSLYLCSVGMNRLVHVLDRAGQQIDEFQLPGQQINTVRQMEWDKDGEWFAIMCDNLSIITLWNVHTRKSTSLETNLKESPTFMAWSRTTNQLAIGTAKGNLMLYSTATRRSTLIQGKHSKKITCGAWNLDNKLALASLDKTLSINDERGELVEQAKLKYDPVDIQFAEQKMDAQTPMAGGGKEMTVSINMGHQTILMYNMADQDNPVELAFQPKYGEIATYKWFGDGYMMVGFSKGYVIAISTHMKEIGEELQSLKVHESSLYDVVFSSQLNKLATCGDDGLRVVDMTDWKELKSEHREFNREEGDPERMEWTKDGQILSVATSGGYLFNFLMAMPVLSAYHQTKLLYLSSLRHVSIVDVGADSAPVVSLEIAIEPSFLALGPTHVAVGMNNHCWFHLWHRVGSATISARELAQSIVYEREYIGSVKSIALNEHFAAVLLDNGRLNLHLIANEPESERDSKLFPTEEEMVGGGGAENVRITSAALTAEFLIYSTSKGTIHHFFLKDYAQVAEHRHEVSVAHVYPNPLGTRVVFIDHNARAFMYSPVDESKFEIPDFPPANAIDKVLWDHSDPNTFVAVDTKNTRSVTTFAYASQTTRGPQANKVATTKLMTGFAHVVVFYDGYIHGQKATGALTSMVLASHDAIGAHKSLHPRAHRSSDRIRHSLQQLLALNRLKQAWEVTLLLHNADSWHQLARKALDLLDTELGIRIYRELKETAMVLALQELQDVEDKDLLAGHILMLQGEYNDAQRFFLASSQPIHALQMRRDLLHWDISLKLASQLAPQEIPSICREYAQQLEVKGDYQTALNMYQRSLQEDPTVLAANGGRSLLSKEHVKAAQAGITRMTIRVGDLQKGRSLAMQSGDKQLIKECAIILEQMKQLTDAAELYVKAEQYERAASIYNQTLNFAKAAPLMDKISTPKIHLQYAKAKESAKEWAAAAAAYEKAKDMDSVIRINLQYLDNADRAFQIVRQTKSAEGAALVAAYCQQHHNFQAAIEFLLLAKRSEEAFNMAKEHKEMDKFCIALGDDGTMEEYAAIAAYYEEEKDYAQAAAYYSRIGDYAKSVKLYLQCDTQHIDDAIQVVKKAQGTPGADLLVRQLHDFLIGETDGRVKDLNFIFRLYMAIGEYAQAASTAILIANQEQTCGQYAVAHSILFAMYQDLVANKLAIPNELRRNLLLLHSYTLAKKMSARKDHAVAARMLIRVSRNISRFPAHIVPILTSTVIECQRAGLKKDSLEFAKILLRPEHKSKVAPQYLKPIEGFVRRPPSQEDMDKEAKEKSTPCPYCQFMLPETMLECPACKNNLPYCITTGKHMVLNDWSECPSCHHPTLYSAFIHYLSTSQDKKCCMCNQAIALADVAKVFDPKSKLLKASEEEKQNEDEQAHTDGTEEGAGGLDKSIMDAVDIQPVFK